MIYSIEVRVNFRSAHRLLPPYKGKCNSIHGEYYTAIIHFKDNKLNNCGMIFDFGDIKRRIKDWVDAHWDHGFICNKKDELKDAIANSGSKVYVMEENPTAELMARELYMIIKHKLLIPNLEKVGIIESDISSIGWYQEK